MMNHALVNVGGIHRYFGTNLILYLAHTTLQSRLPNFPGWWPHCFLPLLVWTDDGNITKTVKKHPVILCAAFLPGAIRNGSGNAGGFLLGYMVVVSCLGIESSSFLSE